jgi:hypothetical protein
VPSGGMHDYMGKRCGSEHGEWRVAENPNEGVESMQTCAVKSRINEWG